MEIRKDFEGVSLYIFRLLSFSQIFSDNDKTWNHLKNKEDYNLIYKFPVEERYKIEDMYRIGRSVAIYMKEELFEINCNFLKYPTLTSVIEKLHDTSVLRECNKKVPDMAVEICNKNNAKLWSVEQMHDLFKNQEKIIAVIRDTLDLLKSSDLYKLENKIEIMDDKQKTIYVSGVSGSSININSNNATATVNQVYNEPEIFYEMIQTIKSSGLGSEDSKNLIDNTQALAVAHKNGNFSEAYIDFMQNISSHITVFTPFLSSLAAMLSSS